MFKSSRNQIPDFLFRLRPDSPPVNLLPQRLDELLLLRRRRPTVLWQVAFAPSKVEFSVLEYSLLFPFGRLSALTELIFRRYPDFRFHDGTALPYRPLSPIHEMPRSIREVRPPGGKSFSQRVLSGGSSHHNRPSRHSRVGGHYAVDLESDSGYPEVRNGSA